MVGCRRSVNLQASNVTGNHRNMYSPAYSLLPSSTYSLEYTSVRLVDLLTPIPMKSCQAQKFKTFKNSVHRHPCRRLCWNSRRDHRDLGSCLTCCRAWWLEIFQQHICPTKILFFLIQKVHWYCSETFKHPFK